MLAIKRKVQYLDVADKIRYWIKTQKLKPDTPIMSCRDIAQKYQVSPKTARNAVMELVKDDLLYLVQGSGTFIKKTTKKERQLEIGCAIGAESYSVDNKLLNQFIHAPLNYLKKNGCNIRHIPNVIVHDNNELKKYIEGLDGFLVSAVSVNLHECTELYKIDLPIVIYQSEHEFNLPFSQVVPDHFIAMRKFFAKVNPRSYSKLIILYQDYSNLIARRDAFAACALEAGFSSEQIEYNEIGMEGAYGAGIKISKISDSKLIFATAGNFAAQAYNALRENGKIPGIDFEMVGYDNKIGADLEGKSPVTTIDYSHETTFLIAAELLVKEIRKKRDFKQIIKVPTNLIIRNTTLS